MLMIDSQKEDAIDCLKEGFEIRKRSVSSDCEKKWVKSSFVRVSL